MRAVYETTGKALFLYGWALFLDIQHAARSNMEPIHVCMCTPAPLCPGPSQVVVLRSVSAAGRPLHSLPAVVCARLPPA
jgi:hypothetical protein